MCLFNHALGAAEEGTHQGTLPMLLAEKREIKPDPTWLLRMADICLDRGNDESSDKSDRLAAYEQGMRYAQQALTLDEKNAHAHYLYAANVGSATQLKGMMVSALTVHDVKRHIRRALELDSHHAEALHMMGMMLEELPWILGGDRDSALNYLRRAVAIDQNDASARLDLAKIYIKRKDVEAARKELDILLSQSPPPGASSSDQRHWEEALYLRDSLQTSDRRF
jgi:tetratricopeptide (TPR) repeat protein